MKRINLNNLDYFKESIPLLKLNRFIKIRTQFTMHEIAIASGCDFKNAMFIVLILYHHYAADLFLVIYHNDHLDNPIAAEIRPFLEGFPKLPYVCFLCERRITSLDQLSFDFMVKLLHNNIEFVSKNDESE
jgi:hypothetical protein